MLIEVESSPGNRVEGESVPGEGNRIAIGILREATEMTHLPGIKQSIVVGIVSGKIMCGLISDPLNEILQAAQEFVGT